MAGQTTIYPKKATLNPGGDTITIELNNGCTYRLRPRNKAPGKVCDDLNQRAKARRSARLGDRSGDWFFEYREPIPGQERAAPDHDRKVLRAHEIESGVD